MAFLNTAQEDGDRHMQLTVELEKPSFEQSKSNMYHDGYLFLVRK